MKKWMMVVSGLVAAVLMLTAFTGEALAWGGPQGDRGARSAQGSTGYRYGFVDEDDDGINDRAGECDGIPAYAGDGEGFRYGFVDEDDDGINDRAGECDGVPAYDGEGAGFRYGFVDEDSDGVNDRAVECAGVCDGTQRGRGERWSR